MLVDSHCHLTDERFQEDRPEVLLRAKEAGVDRIVSIASDLEDARRVVALLEDSRGPPGEGWPALWGTAGIHPHEAEGAGDEDLEGIRDLLASHPRLVAVGETGLDFFYDNSPRHRQEELFRGHLALASELDLPVVVHNRSADSLTAEVLREWRGRVRGVLHCFTGGRELLETALDVGWMVSFTGIITFKKYDGQELVRIVPRDRLMVETDAPYLAPVPHRGKRNEPAFVCRVAESVAALRGEEAGEVLEYTTENAIRFFGLTP
ncbi:MAG: TatD family hydrolase [Gemmatimonadota bacterium]|jgi:TatD DNase family protein